MRSASSSTTAVTRRRFVAPVWMTHHATTTTTHEADDTGERARGSAPTNDRAHTKDMGVVTRAAAAPPAAFARAATCLPAVVISRHAASRARRACNLPPLPIKRAFNHPQKAAQDDGDDDGDAP
jgi:hypothetical protein